MSTAVIILWPLDVKSPNFLARIRALFRANPIQRPQQTQVSVLQTPVQLALIRVGMPCPLEATLWQDMSFSQMRSTLLSSCQFERPLASVDPTHLRTRSYVVYAELAWSAACQCHGCSQEHSLGPSAEAFSTRAAAHGRCGACRLQLHILWCRHFPRTSSVLQEHESAALPTPEASTTK